MKILVVDDDDAVRNTIIDILISADYEVESSSNGEEALERLKSDKFDLVITDIIMPKKSGVALLDFIRSSDYKIPVLAVSGHSSQTASDTLNFAGHLADKILAKPFEPDDLLETVEKLLLKTGASSLYGRR